MTFSKIVREHGCKIGAEVGVAYAGHATYLLSTCPSLELLYGIDPYHSYRENFRLEYFEKLYAYILDRTRVYGTRYRHIRKWSADGAADVPDNSLDFVFIDANHNYAYVLEDIKLWTPKVKAGGIVGGHDYNENLYPGTISAVSEQRYKQLFLPGSFVWWTYKEKESKDVK